jgi:hypothetical protein
MDIKRPISNMFQYKCTIFREYITPHLKPLGNEKLLFTRFYRL